MVAEKWVTVAGYDVCVDEDDRVIRATRDDHGSVVPAMPYRYDRRQQVWVNAKGVKRNTLRAGLRSGSYAIK